MTTVTPELDLLETDDEAWDAFVAAGPGNTHLQTTAWGNVKRANGWRSRRVAINVGGITIGTQMLIRRAGRLPLKMGYVARGPVGAKLTTENVGPLTVRLLDQARADKLSFIVFEPEAPSNRELEDALEKQGWRRTSRVQPDASRLIDLTRTHDELWSDLRGKWRQYVNRARRDGVRVSRAGEERLDDFFAVYTDAYRRAGVTFRNDESFAVLWRELAPRGMAHLFIAESAEGEPQATLLLLSCGGRVAEVYGGSTEAGNKLRANYLIKWEAIDHFRELGFTEYDMYGIPHAGIAHFKAGFGGQEVQYVGAWEMAVDRLGGSLVSMANRLRVRYVKVRYGRGRRTDNQG